MALRHVRQCVNIDGSNNIVRYFYNSVIIQMYIVFAYIFLKYAIIVYKFKIVN